MRKAILHIGLEKTGSTAIQEFLWINRHTLLDRHQTWTPDYLGRGSQWLLAVLAYNRSREDELTNNLGSPAARMAKLEEIRKKITYSVNHQPANLFCFSSEHLSSRLTATEDIYRLKDFFSELFDDIEVVVYVREPIRMAISLQSTAVKLGHGVFRLPEPSQIAATLDFQAVIQRWESAFGERMRVRLYDERLSEFDVISDFQTLLGLSSSLSSEIIRPKRINPSLGWNQLRLMSGINAVAQRQLGHPLPIAILRHITNVLEEADLALDGQTTPYKPTKKQAESYRLYFSKQNEWLFSTYFPDRPFQWNPPSAEKEIDTTIEPSIRLSNSEEILCQLLVDLTAGTTVALGDIAEHLSQISWKIRMQEPFNLHDQEASERFCTEIKSTLAKD